jgi:hypothetical protein
VKNCQLRIQKIEQKKVVEGITASWLWKSIEILNEKSSSFQNRVPTIE